ncbi:MAG: exonuclease subunit SbcD [Candidatus Thermoplasmatota archaeon]|nr:exonuclease subunit SbcD [Candidatus Thermoplasmatota archaeon]
MKILHTSDWHLGKSIHGMDLLEDQAKVLGDLETELENDYDALLIAGDIYDRSIPPQEAVELFSSFIERMVELGVQVVVIPGNHDSPVRLDFASGVLEHSGIHFRCRYDRIAEPIIIEDHEGEKVQVFALPFVDEVHVRSLYPDKGIRTHQEATEFLIGEIKSSMDGAIPSILVTHAYTGKHSIRTDSERELLVGDHGLIAVETFEGFDYVAMGHLHRPQDPGGSICYSGSLIPYSFSEAEHEKGSRVLHVEKGRIDISRSKHQLRRRFALVEAGMNELLTDERYEGLRDHYLSVKLTDQGLLMDIHRRLRERFPYVLEIDQPALHIEGGNEHGITREEADNPSILFSLFLDRFGWEDDENRALAMEIFEDARKELERKEGSR